MHFLLNKGDPPFKSILNEEISPPENSQLIDPLIVYDLNRDGYPEILLVAKNLLYRRQSDGAYRPEKLCQFPTPYIWTALVADFDGDGFPDKVDVSRRLAIFANNYPDYYETFRPKMDGPFEPAIENEYVFASPSFAVLGFAVHVMTGATLGAAQPGVCSVMLTLLSDEIE